MLRQFFTRLIVTSFAGLMSVSALNAATNNAVTSNAEANMTLSDDAYNWSGRYRLKDGTIIEHIADSFYILAPTQIIMNNQIITTYQKIPRDNLNLIDITSQKETKLTAKSTHESFMAALMASGQYDETLFEVIPIDTPQR